MGKSFLTYEIMQMLLRLTAMYFIHGFRKLTFVGKTRVRDTALSGGLISRKWVEVWPSGYKVKKWKSFGFIGVQLMFFMIMCMRSCIIQTISCARKLRYLILEQPCVIMEPHSY